MTQSFVFLTRTAIALAAVGGIGVMALDGCGPGDTKYYCDNSGCYNCDGYGCHPVTPPTPTKCTGASSCQQNQICTDQGCENICKADADCPQGDVCKSGLCVAATSTNPGNPVLCTTNSDCGTNQVCVGSGSWAKCVDKTNACTYSSECGAGKVCADGECLVDCSKGATCPSGTQCTKGICEPTAGTQCTSDAQCGGSTPKCVDGSCAPACGLGTSSCGANEVCENGACVPDTQPQPNCNLGCAANQQCIDGFCRYTCTTPDGNLSQQCELIDTRIGYCAKDSTCRDAQEAQAQCLSSAQCGTGQICISNTCQ